MLQKLSVFAKIKGIGAASGLLLKKNLLYIIGDNSAYLSVYNIVDKELHQIQILQGLLKSQNIPKADKPDFASLCHHNEFIYVLGSGSTAKRNEMISYDLSTKKVVQHDLTKVYALIKKKYTIDNDNFNVEGAIFAGTRWFLFNRGNGNLAKNGIFKIDGADLKNANQVEFFPIALLKIDKTLVSFTDAVLHEDQIYFVAAAEETTSTYHDGKILGSYFGSLKADTLQLNYIKKISDQHKFEGLTLFKQSGSVIEFLLCEDTDGDILETTIYKLTI